MHAKPRLSSNSIWPILCLWAIVSAFNLSKAVHIDDPVHLLIARNIVQDPFHPYSGMLNWVNYAKPMYYVNQPPLLFYFYAGAMYLFGESELALHIVFSIFSFGAIYFFYRLARGAAERYTLLLTTILFVSPAFIPSQNLMTDVPVLSLWLMFFYLIVRNFEQDNKWFGYGVAAIVAGAACLIKYVSLVLLPILPLAVFLSGRWRNLWVILLPILVLALWSLFNEIDYGGIHLLRPIGALSSERVSFMAVDWVVCLGSITPFSILLFPYAWKHRYCRYGISIVLMIGMICYPTRIVPSVESGDSLSLFTVSFWLNGLFVVGTLVFCLCSRLIHYWKNKSEYFFWDSIIFAWFIGAALFIILFAPFIAVRHVLLALPALVLIIGRYMINDANRFVRNCGLSVTIVLGLALSVSDFLFADTYRQHARVIRQELGEEARIWSLGHWGWQWYAERAGMMTYDSRETVIHEGDYVVVPELLPRQELKSKYWRLLEKRKEIVVPVSPLTLLRSMTRNPWGGFYSSYTFCPSLEHKSSTSGGFQYLSNEAV